MAKGKSASAIAEATGGAGGTASGAGYVGGAGGGASASAKVTATGAAAGEAGVSQTGGAGGAGSGGAGGGVGGSSTLTNAVTGSTAGGVLDLIQEAYGGAGGASSGGGAGGAGGAASSSLNFNDLLSNTASTGVAASVNATGGAGGGGASGSNGANGGLGTVSLVVRGSGTVSATGIAYGGAGGLGGTGGNGGGAVATVSAYGAYVSAQSDAVGGAGTIAGHANAKTKVVGTGGLFSAYAYANHPAAHLIKLASARAFGVVDGSQSAKAKVTIGGVVLPLAAQGQAVANEAANPSAASVAPILNANTNIKTAFGTTPSFFAVAEVGGAYAKSGGTGAQTTTDVINLQVDLTKLSSLHDLMVGFFDPTAVGAGFTSLTFTLTGDGQTLINQTFTTLAQAKTFFTDDARDLGALTGAPFNSSTTLTLQATLRVTTDAPGAGYYFQFVVGDPPPAAPRRGGQRPAVRPGDGRPGPCRRRAGRGGGNDDDRRPGDALGPGDAPDRLRERPNTPLPGGVLRRLAGGEGGTAAG